MFMLPDMLFYLSWGFQGILLVQLLILPLKNNTTLKQHVMLM